MQQGATPEKSRQLLSGLTAASLFIANGGRVQQANAAAPPPHTHPPAGKPAAVGR